MNLLSNLWHRSHRDKDAEERRRLEERHQHELEMDEFRLRRSVYLKKAQAVVSRTLEIKEQLEGKK